MGANVYTLAWRVAVTNGSAFPSPYVPDPEVYGTFYSLHNDLGDYFIDDKVDCQFDFAPPIYHVVRIGCNDPNPALHVDGAHMVDHVTIGTDNAAEMIPVSGYTQDIDHKFY